MYGERRGVYRVLVGKAEDHLENPGVHWRIILRWIFQEVGWGHGLDGPDLEKGQVAASCECGNKHSGCIKCGELLD